MGQQAKTRTEIILILNKIKYDKPSWTWVLKEKGNGFLLQWTFLERDLTDPNPNAEEEEQFGRKWYVSPYMTESEIVRTAFLAIQQAEMHEIAERFTFNGVRIFDPHMNYVHLAELIDDIGTDNRIPKDQK
jgi:hypothetical protein